MFPLGPLNSKSLGSTISPWIVTPAALENFRVAAPERHLQGGPAPYLEHKQTERTSYNIQLRAELITPNGTETTIAKCTTSWMYWTFKDMVAHQTINGCSLRTGDVLGTGAVSGLPLDGRGCLLEMSKAGKESFKLSDGSERKYLEDGDAIRMVGWAGESPESGVGFGECFGRIVKGAEFNH